MKSLEEKITTFDNGSEWNGPAGDNQKDRKPKWESDLENFGGIYGYIQ